MLLNQSSKLRKSLDSIRPANRTPDSKTPARTNRFRYNPTTKNINHSIDLRLRATIIYALVQPRKLYTIHNSANQIKANILNEHQQNRHFLFIWVRVIASNINIYQ